MRFFLSRLNTCEGASKFPPTRPPLFFSSFFPRRCVLVVVCYFCLMGAKASLGVKGRNGVFLRSLGACFVSPLCFSNCVRFRGKQTNKKWENASSFTQPARPYLLHPHTFTHTHTRPINHRRRRHVSGEFRSPPSSSSPPPPPQNTPSKPTAAVVVIRNTNHSQSSSSSLPPSLSPLTPRFPLHFTSISSEPEDLAAPECCTSPVSTTTRSPDCTKPRARAWSRTGP